MVADYSGRSTILFLSFLECLLICTSHLFCMLDFKIHAKKCKKKTKMHVQFENLKYYYVLWKKNTLFYKQLKMFHIFWAISYVNYYIIITIHSFSYKCVKLSVLKNWSTFSHFLNMEKKILSEEICDFNDKYDIIDKSSKKTIVFDSIKIWYTTISVITGATIGKKVQDKLSWITEKTGIFVFQ